MRFLNFENDWAFKYKFKRDPKYWSISDVHDLWVRAKERAKVRHNAVKDCIQDIFNTVEPNNREEYIVYFFGGPKKDIIYAYTITKRYGYSYSNQLAKLDITTKRDISINGILGSVEFKLGERLRKNEKLLTTYQFKILQVLNGMIEKKIEMYKIDKGDHHGYFLQDRHEIINISGKKYIFIIKNHKGSIAREIKSTNEIQIT